MALPIYWLDPIQPCQEPPCIQKYLTIMYLIVMHRIVPFDIPARSALPSVRSLSPSTYHTQVWGSSYDSQPSSILTPPSTLLAWLPIPPCIIPIKNDDGDDESILVYAWYWNVLIRIKKKGKSPIITDSAGSYNVHSSSFNDSENIVELKRNDSLNFTNKLFITLLTKGENILRRRWDTELRAWHLEK